MANRGEEPERSNGDWRWQYAILWRYGPLGLVLLGLAMVAFAMLVEKSDAVTISLLTLGFFAVIAGVVLPRIEGDFSAGGQGVAGKLLGVTQDRRFAVEGPALALDSKESHPDQDLGIMFGDVWDELEANGFRVIDVGAGHRLLEDDHGRQIELPSRGHAEGLEVSPELLAQIRALGLTPTASRKYSTSWHGVERLPQE